MRRRWVALAALHVLYAGTWIALTPHGDAVFERWATAAGMAVAGVFYVAMVFAFVWARKSRLNAAFAYQKLNWSGLVWLVAFPLQAGLIVHHAPYRSVVSPYALYTVPGYVRTYLWLFMAVATIGVAWEFWQVNWGGNRRGGGTDTVVSIEPDRSGEMAVR